MIKSPSRRRFLGALLSFSSAISAHAYGRRSENSSKASSTARTMASACVGDDAIWAFQLGNATENVITTGAVFRCSNWDELGCYSGRGLWTEQTVLMKRHASRHRMIKDEVALFDAACTSNIFVAIANPDDQWSWRRAVESCVVVSRNNVATILIAARQEKLIYEAEGVPIPYLREYGGDHPLYRSRVWGSYAKFSKQCDEWSGETPVDVSNTSRKGVCGDRQALASCVVEAITGDIYLELTSTVEAVGSYWPGMIGTDYNDVCIALGLDRPGWKARGVSSGEDRAVAAARSALENLEKSAGENLASAKGVLVFVLTGQDYSWREFGLVRRVISASIPSDCHVVLDHVLRPDFHTFLQVDILLTVANRSVGLS